MPQPTTKFPSEPLAGVTILVTRPERQAAGMRRLLADRGAEVLVQPAIEIGPPDDWSGVDEALARLDQFDWLVFSSTNGVEFFFQRIRTIDRQSNHHDSGCISKHLVGLKLAAIGPSTAAELSKRGLHVDLVPEGYRAEALADELIKTICDTPDRLRFLLAGANRSRPLLRERLIAAGCIVERIVVYTSRGVAADSPGVARLSALMAAGRIDWVTVTSSAIARSLARMFGENLRRTKLSSISPVTSGVLVELGFEPAVEARSYTIEGIAEAILEAKRMGL